MVLGFRGARARPICACSAILEYATVRRATGERRPESIPPGAADSILEDHISGHHEPLLAESNARHRAPGWG